MKSLGHEKACGSVAPHPAHEERRRDLRAGEVA